MSPVQWAYLVTGVFTSVMLMCWGVPVICRPELVGKGWNGRLALVLFVWGMTAVVGVFVALQVQMTLECLGVVP